MGSTIRNRGATGAKSSRAVNNGEDAQRKVTRDDLDASLRDALGRSGSAATTLVSKDGNNATAKRGVPGLPYKTVQAAVAAAAPGDIIEIAAGIFVENVVMGTDLVLRGRDPRWTVIQGAVSYVPVSDADAFTKLSNLKVTGTVSFDGTGMTGEDTISFLVLENVNCPLATSVGRVGKTDGVYLVRCGPFPEGGAADIQFSDGVFVVDGSFVNSAVCLAATQGNFTSKRSHFFDDLDMGVHGNGDLEGCYLNGGFRTSASNDNSVSHLHGCTIDGAINAGEFTTIDARRSFLRPGNVNGPGEVRRDIDTGQVTTSPGAGDKVVTLDVPIGITDYTILLCEVGATPGGITPSLVSQTGNGFTIHDTVGGRTFNYTILMIPAFGPS